MKFSSRTLVAALALASAASAIAQVTPDPIAPLPTAKGQQPAAQLPAPLPTPPAPPIVLPPPFWPVADAADLLSVIQSADAEGLTAKDYNPAGLADAIASRDANRVAQVATDSFNKLSSDFVDLGAMPPANMAAIRPAITAVLPEPAPASTRMDRS